MRKPKLVIASVLKPVNDTRLFEKFGLSLSQTSKYDINIIGFYTKKIKKYPDISCYSLYKSGRTSFKRLLVSWKYYKILRKLKPEVVIVTTPELLPVSCVFKILFGAKIYYDVQENYYRNIRYSPTYPPLLKLPLASIVRGIEKCADRWIKHYLLAEKCYLAEINFPKHKTSIVQNKFKPLYPVIPAKPLSKKPQIRLLYTGTIGKNYGIFEAIQFTKNISIVHPQVSLKIIGYAPDKHTYKKVAREIRNHPYISLEGGDRPVSHESILEACSEADYALLPYQPDKSIENCFPTKIWEYMAYQLPMIIQDHKPWVSYCKTFDACIAIDFKTVDPGSVLQQMFTFSFYKNGLPKDIYWESEELTLLEALEEHTPIK